MYIHILIHTFFLVPGNMSRRAGDRAIRHRSSWPSLKYRRGYRRGLKVHTRGYTYTHT